MQYPFAVRRATSDDRDAVVALCRDIDPHDWVPGAYSELIGMPPPQGLYLAVRDGGLVGCYYLMLSGPGEAYLSAMRISPSLQGQGLGSLFCRAQVEQARAVGAGTIYLLSETKNSRAHRTVERAGFERVGEWVIYHDLAEIPMPAGRGWPATAQRDPAPESPEADPAPTGTATTVRFAGPTDADAIRRFVRERQRLPVHSVISAQNSGWAFHSLTDQEILPKHTVVALGPDGIEAVMLRSFDEGWMLIRWLGGAADGVTDLLAWAAVELKQEQCQGADISLPAVDEAVLAPLGLDPALAFRAYVFRLPGNRALPPL